MSYSTWTIERLQQKIMSLKCQRDKVLRAYGTLSAELKEQRRALCRYFAEVELAQVERVQIEPSSPQPFPEFRVRIEAGEFLLDYSSNCAQTVVLVLDIMAFRKFGDSLYDEAFLEQIQAYFFDTAKEMILQGNLTKSDLTGGWHFTVEYQRKLMSNGFLELDEERQWKRRS